MVQFQKAVKYGALLRLALIGTSGSGKTYSALAIATGLGLPIAFIDTERGSARKYADLFDFDVLELESFSVDNFIAAINAAEKGGYRVLIIDSLSHAWSGKDGILEFVDMETAKSRAKNAYTSGWRSATPLHNKLVDTILGCKMHVIACMRSKSEYVMEEVNGKKVPRKIGLQPVQREGMEYEFDVLGDLDQDHNLVISKSRCAAIDNKLFHKPGAEFAAILNEWLGGAEAPAPVAKPSAPIATPDPAAPVTPLRSDDVEKAVAKLSKRLRSYYEQGINGFNDVAVMKADMKLMLGIDDLKLATDDHMENILLWHNGLGGLLSNRDMLPFTHYPLIPETGEYAISSTPAPPAIDYDAILVEIDAEISKRHIPQNIADSIVKSAMSMAESKSQSIAMLVSNVKAYPLKSEPASDAVKNLHNEIKFRHEVLIAHRIDGYDVSKRLANSISEHLGTKTVKQCTDPEKLGAYALHLQSKIDEAAKKEVS